jgi:NtrC-family two-component system response regulator AlgB
MLAGRHDREALLVGLEPALRRSLVSCLETLGFHCRHVGRDAPADESTVDLVFIDERRMHGPGDPDRIIRIVESAEDAVDAAEHAAAEWIELPIRPRIVRAVVERLMARRKLERQVRELTRTRELDFPPPTLIAYSNAMRETVERLDIWTGDLEPILLEGSPGTGRGFIARRLAHKNELGLSEIRGEVLRGPRGVNQVHEAVAAAGRGTLLIREVDRADDEVQEDLAQRIAEVERVKIILTAPEPEHRALRPELRRVLQSRAVTIPPLCERIEDLGPLASFFLSHYAPSARFSSAALKALESYGWPGNVAELRTVVESCTFLSQGVIDPHHLPERVLAGNRGARYLGGDFTLAEIEWAHLSAILATGRPLNEVARVLGIDDSTLWRIRKRHAQV